MSGGSEALQKFYDINGAGGGDSVYKITAAGTYNLTLQQRNVDVEMASLAADVNVNLPDAAQAKGMIFSVFLSSFAGSNDLAVAGPGVGTDFASGDMDTTGEWVVVYSDGFRWLLLASNIA